MKTLTKNFLLCSIFFFTTTLTAQQLHVTNPVGAVQEAVLIDNPANTEGVLILNTAAANPLPALQARSAGTGEAVHGENTLSGASLFGLKQGAATGRAGLFANMNATNPSPTLQSITNGLGRAGQFQNTNAANVSAALSASTNSPGPAIEGINNAAGPSIEGGKNPRYWPCRYFLQCHSRQYECCSYRPLYRWSSSRGHQRRGRTFSISYQKGTAGALGWVLGQQPLLRIRMRPI